MYVQRLEGWSLGARPHGSAPHDTPRATASATQRTTCGVTRDENESSARRRRALEDPADTLCRPASATRPGARGRPTVWATPPDDNLARAQHATTRPVQEMQCHVCVCVSTYGHPTVHTAETQRAVQKRREDDSHATLVPQRTMMHVRTQSGTARRLAHLASSRSEAMHVNACNQARRTRREQRIRSERRSVARVGAQGAAS